MIKQIRKIDEIFNMEAKELRKIEFSKVLKKAIKELKKEKVQNYLENYSPCPHFIKATKLIETELQKNNIDALRLKIYVNEGLSVNMKPNFDDLENLYKQLYDLTLDEEIIEVLKDFENYLSKARVNHLDELYWKRIDSLGNAKISSSIDSDSRNN